MNSYQTDSQTLVDQTRPTWHHNPNGWYRFYTHAAGAPLRKEKLKGRGHWQMVRRTLLQTKFTKFSTWVCAKNGTCTVYSVLYQSWIIIFSTWIAITGGWKFLYGLVCASQKIKPACSHQPLQPTIIHQKSISPLWWSNQFSWWKCPLLVISHEISH